MGLRSWNLAEIPGGVLDDDVRGLSYQKHAYKKHNYQLYRTRHNFVESLHCMFQGILPQFPKTELENSPYHGYVLSILVFLLWVLLLHKNSSSHLFTCLVVVFLVFNNWHFFYSRIFCTATGVLFFMLLSSWIFLKVPHSSFKILWLLFLLVINLLGLIYYPSFRIFVFSQLLLGFTYRRILGVKTTTLLIILVLGFLAILGLFIATDTPLSAFWYRSLSKIGVVKTNYLLNIWYSLIIPIIKPSVLYSKFSEVFIGDPISYAFYATSEKLIVGLTSTFFYLVGVLICIFNSFRFIKSGKTISVDNFPVLYATVSFLLFTLIVGLAGPSFSRLLPLTLSSSLLCGVGFRFCLDQSRFFTKRVRVALQLVLIISLVAMPVHAFDWLSKIPDNNIVRMFFLSNEKKLMDKLKEDPIYQKQHKFIYNLNFPYLCSYYQNIIPNMTCMFTLTNKILKKPVGRFYLYWPYYADFPKNLFAMSYRFKLRFNRLKYMNDPNLFKINLIRENNQPLFYEVIFEKYSRSLYWKILRN